MNEPYRTEVLLRAIDLLDALSTPATVLRLRDLCNTTGLHKTTALRLLRTLESRGYVERVGPRGYRATISRLKQKTIRVAYASRDERLSFPRAVTESLRQEADRAGVELAVFDNQLSRARTIRNAQAMIDSRIDLAILFGADEDVSPILAAQFSSAGIPVISIDQPIPGAYYYGADNHTAGLSLGRQMAAALEGTPHAAPDEIVLLRFGKGGSIVYSRLTGAESGFVQSPRVKPPGRVVQLDGKGTFNDSLRAMRGYLRTARISATAPSVVLFAANDPSALGAAHAVAEAGRERSFRIGVIGGSLHIRNEMRRAQSPVIAAVGLAPESYGAQILPKALAILAKKHVPPATFAPHRILTRANLDELYPIDQLLIEPRPVSR